MDARVCQYLETALWSSTDIDTGEPLDKNHEIDDLAPSAVRQAERDVAAFWKVARKLLNATPASYDDERAAHDFWLTRNRHGAGFWDRSELKKDDLGNRRLTEIAHCFGEVDLYVGDNGKLYFSPEKQRKGVRICGRKAAR